MTWYRVYFRKKHILVQGDDELARLQARKVPKVISFEIPKMHTCTVCGKEEPWIEETWSWYGRYADIDDGKPVLKFCSNECRDTEKRPEIKSGDWKDQKRTNRGVPDNDFSHHRKQSEIKDAANVRKFPHPQFPKDRSGDGWCRWCGEKVTEKRRRTWHSECLAQFFQHTDLHVQRSFLAKRDGDRCALCPPGTGRWVDAGAFPSWMKGEGNWIKWSQQLEVDHVTPLWMVAHLPPDDRRPYHGPANLWLLCQEHHRWKSSHEAAERKAAG